MRLSNFGSKFNLSTAAVGISRRLGPGPFILIAVFAAPEPSPATGEILGIPTFCPFRRITGIPCPGCGITRSLVCAAHGDWASSLAYHPLGIAVLAALVCYSAYHLFLPRLEFPPRLAAAGNAIGIAALSIVFLARSAHLILAGHP